ncbi:hypothetical protein [Clostridium perfringens]|uniref:hypothetical protein n=1 Tax=Clostridium perfringens TaxID=1502 RepID=UPI003D80225A
MLIILFWSTNGSMTIASILNTLTSIIFTAIYFKFSYNDFTTIYIKIIIFLGIISLFGYFSDLTNSFGFLVDKLPRLITSNSKLGNPTGGFFYVFRNINKINQNCGICYEPGKYQFLLNLAMYFMLFCKNGIKKKKLVFLILSITIATTMSTTGIVMYIVIIIAYLISNKDSISKSYIILIFIITAIVIFSFFYDEITVTLFKKMNFNFSTMTFEYGSGNTRLNDISLDIEIFLNNIWGNGWRNYKNYWELKQYGNYLYTTGSSSNSLTSMFAVYGILFSLYINIKYITNFIFKSKSIIIILLLLITYFYQNLSQSFSLTPLMIIFLLSKNDILYGKDFKEI